MQAEIEKREISKKPSQGVQIDEEAVDEPEEAKNEKRTVGIPLKNFKQLKEQVKRDHAAENARAEGAQNIVIGLNDFVRVWKDFAESAREKGKKSLHMLMTANAPTEISKNAFQIKVSTETLRETFVAEKMNLIDAIAKEFGTTHVEIAVEIEELSDDAKTKFLATPKEKYEHMVKINPELKNLMDELGLDFNF